MPWFTLENKGTTIVGKALEAVVACKKLINFHDEEEEVSDIKIAILLDIALTASQDTHEHLLFMMSIMYTEKAVCRE